MKNLLHIGICTQSVENVIKLLRNTVGVSNVSYADMPELGQRIAYVYVGDNNALFELMEPLGDKGGTVATFLEKHGEGLHHISFEVDRVEDVATDFEAQGCKIIGRRKGVAYVHPKTAYGVLYELLDSTYE